MGKYVDDALALRVWEAAAAVASGPEVPVVPFVWDGGQWVTQGGEYRDLPLIRRGMGEWLLAVAVEMDAAGSAAARRTKLRDRLSELYEAMPDARTEDEEDRLSAEMGEVRRLLDLEDARMRIAVDYVTAHRTRDIAEEMRSASVGRANQLLSQASQFDAFRAAMKDPADWVARLSAAPRTEHVRTSAVWEAFSVAEPALARSLGARTGKSVLFAAMDRRFGARRKLSGYEGWRGAALPVTAS
ncbi:hypothetical protein [Kitasatospora sp. GAS1066B]|uniref:hypothetical protein n=1 Tax=Kitasatospora sp. GAS1066B TaxID=3156271 RepID=UPI0035169980